MYENLTVLGMARKAMDWVAQRQEVLSENIANSDTPGYIPSDLKDLDFKNVLHTVNQPSVLPTQTDSRHIVPKLQDPNVVQTVKKDYESSPDGNAVVLEEQMDKVGSSKAMYEQVTALFQKNVSLLRMAITGR
jgi:flagellar basal-body rod protein FlgB